MFQSDRIAAARHAVRNALIRFRRVTPGGLARDCLRAQILRDRDISPRALEPRATRLVIGMTTTPDRAGLLLPALRSLIDQSAPADRIILALPLASRRTGAAYPAPPLLPAGVEILRCEDCGPATKLLPVLLEEPNAAIVAVDDDVIYPADFLETLLREHLARPDAAIGYRGWRVEPDRDPKRFDHVFATALKDAAEVDILLGTWGYLIPPGALDGAVHDFDGWPEAARWVDDVWISGHLARRGIRRFVAPARGLPLETRASRVAALTDGLNQSGENDRTMIAAFSPWRT